MSEALYDKLFDRAESACIAFSQYCVAMEDPEWAQGPARALSIAEECILALSEVLDEIHGATE